MEKNKIDLRDVTFIIPVRIESDDRKFNFSRVIEFLCDNFLTNIIVLEADKTVSIAHDLLMPLYRKNKYSQIGLSRETKCHIQHYFMQDTDEVFHRTKYLNLMLDLSQTPITVNYDIDVFMEPSAYEVAANHIRNDGFDLVYPYKQGGEIQKRVDFPNKENYNGENLFDPEYHTPWQSYCGHCQFFKTSAYIEGGMENENFYSYGPEDFERMERFQKLGYKVMWGEACIYHLEHTRGLNSNTTNPRFFENEKLMLGLRSMSKDEVREYYNNQEYLKKYRK